MNAATSHLRCDRNQRWLTSTLAIAALVLLALPLQGCATTKPPRPGSKTAEIPKTSVAALGHKSPYAITSGLDGNLWFTEYQGDQIGRITPYGAIAMFQVAPETFAERLTAGPDGAIWFTDGGGNRIGRLDTNEKLGYVNLPHAGSGPAGITTGPDGNIWFTEHSADRIGKLNPHTVQLVEIPIRNGVSPAGIVAGPDGNLWFAENTGNRIGRVTPSGVVTEFELPTPDAHPNTLSAGPDGNVWFTELKAHQIARVTPSGAITEFPLPPIAPPAEGADKANSTTGAPFGIATADKSLWVTITREPFIYRVSPNGDFTAIPTPEGTVASFITAGPDGNL
ncbi:MAG TPA: hypothetical protein VIX59_20985, partial [Candidatus Binataceae bacterium]